MEKEKHVYYDYEDNPHIINEIINELMIVRTIQEIEEFNRALQMTYLKMFPTVSEQGDIIEGMFNDYVSDHNVKEWYESLFKINIVKTK